VITPSGKNTVFSAHKLNGILRSRGVERPLGLQVWLFTIGRYTTCREIRNPRKRPTKYHILYTPIWCLMFVINYSRNSIPETYTPWHIKGPLDVFHLYIKRVQKNRNNILVYVILYFRHHLIVSCYKVLYIILMFLLELVNCISDS